MSHSRRNCCLSFQTALRKRAGAEERQSLSCPISCFFLLLFSFGFEEGKGAKKKHDGIECTRDVIGIIPDDPTSLCFSFASLSCVWEEMEQELVGYWSFDKLTSLEQPVVAGDASLFHHANVQRESLVPSSVLLSRSGVVYGCEDYTLC